MKNFPIRTTLALITAFLLVASAGLLGVQAQERGQNQETGVRMEAEASSSVEARDADSDNDGIPEESERCGSGGDCPREEADADRQEMDGDYNSSRSNKPSPIREEDADSDDDGVDDAERANYNNSRSNRATVRGPDGNDDESTSTEAVRVKELDKATPQAAKRIDKATPKLMQALSIDKSSPLLYDGVSVRAVCGAGGDCDDEDEDVRPDALAVEVSGVQVRGWSAEQKEEVRTQLAEKTDTNDANSFGLRVAQMAIDNEDVTKITSERNQTDIEFRTRLRLLGLIPVRSTATAHAYALSDVQVDYPWYAFLARKGDQSRFASLVAQIRADHDAMISVEEGALRTIREENAE